MHTSKTLCTHLCKRIVVALPTGDDSIHFICSLSPVINVYFYVGRFVVCMKRMDAQLRVLTEKKPQKTHTLLYTREKIKGAEKRVSIQSA